MSSDSDVVYISNCIFTNIRFMITVFELSHFQTINLTNIWFLTTIISNGINIHDANSSDVTLNSLKFIQIKVGRILFTLHDVQSSMIINNLFFSSFSFTTSKLILKLKFNY